MPRQWKPALLTRLEAYSFDDDGDDDDDDDAAKIPHETMVKSASEVQDCCTLHNSYESGLAWWQSRILMDELAVDNSGVDETGCLSVNEYLLRVSIHRIHDNIHDAAVYGMMKLELELEVPMKGAPTGVLFVANTLIEFFRSHPLTLAQTLQLMDKNFVGTRMALLEEDHHCFPHPGAMLQHHVVPGWLFL